MTEQSLQTIVQTYYLAHGRHDLPWRLAGPDGSFDPYKIMVSEIMLQQTQVQRVIPKYLELLAAFPTLTVLAQAPLAGVLRAWNGLGYNRRAKFLHMAARQIIDERQGEFPREVAGLQTLPGIGPNTAGAIAAYAFNQPAVFVETNIRTVFIHHFFHDQTGISEQAIRDLVATTLDHQHPREWYWALMDYGAYLKQTVGNPNRQARSYSKQSQFEGSRRQIRGHVIRLLSSRPHTSQALGQHISDSRLHAVINELLEEGLISSSNGRLSL